MNDIFLATKHPLAFDDIASIAVKFSYRFDRFIGNPLESMKVYYDHNSYWQFMDLRDEFGELNSLSPQEKDMLINQGITTIYIVVHYIDSMDKLYSFLGYIIDIYKGFVGSDGENFEPLLLQKQ